MAVGLGNPGRDFAHTRHNVGADVIDLLARRYGGRLKHSRDHALVCDVTVEGRRLVLAFPQTYMNESGRAVAPLVRHYAITDLARLVVVHDELDLPPGALRVKAGGGLAGHNGLRSIYAHLHSDAFTRVRIGIGKPPGGKEHGIDHVLRGAGKAERELLDVAEAEAADAVVCVLTDGVVAAQNRFNNLQSRFNG